MFVAWQVKWAASLMASLRQVHLPAAGTGHVAAFYYCFEEYLMQQLEFRLNSEFVELNQLLKLNGLCDSGGAGKALVASGAVSVDGHVELRKTCKIRVGQVVTVGDVAINCIAG
jgi:ribosome-associated protein